MHDCFQVQVRMFNLSNRSCLVVLMSSLLLTLGNLLVPEGNKLRIHLAFQQVKFVEHIVLILTIQTIT